MRYKNDKKYQICHHQIHFLKLKMHHNPFSAGAPPRIPLGELTTDPLEGWGGGYPLPARRLRRLELGAAPRFSGPLDTKSWLRQ